MRRPLLCVARFYASPAFMRRPLLCVAQWRTICIWSVARGYGDVDVFCGRRMRGRRICGRRMHGRRICGRRMRGRRICGRRICGRRICGRRMRRPYGNDPRNAVRLIILKIFINYCMFGNLNQSCFERLGGYLLSPFALLRILLNMPFCVGSMYESFVKGNCHGRVAAPAVGSPEGV